MTTMSRDPKTQTKDNRQKIRNIIQNCFNTLLYFKIIAIINIEVLNYFLMSHDQVTPKQCQNAFPHQTTEAHRQILNFTTFSSL